MIVWVNRETINLSRHSEYLEHKKRKSPCFGKGFLLYVIKRGLWKASFYMRFATPHLCVLPWRLCNYFFKSEMGIGQALKPKSFAHSFLPVFLSIRHALKIILLLNFWFFKVSPPFIIRLWRGPAQLHYTIFVGIDSLWNEKEVAEIICDL